MKIIHTTKLFIKGTPTNQRIIDWYSSGEIQLTHASSNELEAIKFDGACEWYNKDKKHLCTCLEVY